MATLSQEGFNLLKGFEGFKNKPYHLKGEKYYTVGLGHYGPDVNPNKIYTDAECMAFFEKDKKRFEEDVNKIYDKRFMNQNMFDACFCFAYMRIGEILNADCICFQVPCISLHFRFSVILRKFFNAVVYVSPASCKLFRKSDSRTGNGRTAAAVAVKS